MRIEWDTDAYFHRDGTRRTVPLPSVMHGWFAKLRGTLLGDEDLRTRSEGTLKQGVAGHLVRAVSSPFFDLPVDGDLTALTLTSRTEGVLFCIAPVPQAEGLSDYHLAEILKEPNSVNAVLLPEIIPLGVDTLRFHGDIPVVVVAALDDR
ncbi:hypothetical protein L218DRAFT_994905 [Marasmius fiardii PR-910]|nr:hypothetical protein L218DRAFT_994905 [Marasmius fiardii PR-910]